MTTIKRQINGPHFGTYEVDAPEACPICHRYNQIEFQLAAEAEGSNGVEAVFRCAYTGCRSFFICFYGRFASTNNYLLKSVRPIKPLESNLSTSVSTLSPMFASIFAEANEARHLGLGQIAGPGFRKAFEFLIKDYAKSLAPTKHDEIEKKLAGRVVEDFVSDGRIQDVAKRCLWLGNDETHYLRKWTDHDICDQVTLIKLTMHWIEIESLSKMYVEEMP